MIFNIYHLALYLVFVFFLQTYIILCKIQPRLKYLKNPNFVNNSEFFMFSRNDASAWKYSNIIMGAVLLAPIRIIIFIVLLISCYLIVKLIILLESPNINLNTSGLTRAVIRFYNRLVLIIFGFYKINKTIKIFPANVKTCTRNNSCNTSLIISNHISFVDIFYFLATEKNVCFVAKAETLKIPIIGLLSKIIGCIFVDRTDPESRKHVISEIQNRFKNGIESKIVFFPEGTTTNGKAILPFKRGVFLSRLPFKLVGLSYLSKGVSPAFTSINMLIEIFGLFCNFQNKINVTEFEDAFRPVNNIDLEILSKEIQNTLADELKVSVTSHTFESKIIFKKQFMT